MADAFNNLPQPVQDYAVAIGGLTAAFTLLMPIIVGFMALGGPTTLIIGAVITVIAGVIAIIKTGAQLLTGLREYGVNSLIGWVVLGKV